MEELTSIILIARNDLEHTKECLRRLEMHTPEAYELILVDNASSDGTAGYFATVPRATHLTRSEPSSLGACINAALQDAIGDYVLLLGPECLVTPGWLGGLLEALRADGAIGAVGPVTNGAFNNPGQVLETSFKNMDEMSSFAASLRSTHAGQIRPANKLGLFCMLMRQDVPEKVGPLDERLVFFLDDDYSLRLRMAGFRMAAAPVYVHRSYVQVPSESDLEEEKKHFAEKWSRVREGLKKRSDELSSKESGEAS